MFLHDILQTTHCPPLTHSTPLWCDTQPPISFCRTPLPSLPFLTPSLQAINFDIALILPGILGALTSASLGHDAYKLAPLTEAGSDVIFVALLVAVAYSAGSSAFGEFPDKLPFFGSINRENPNQEEDL